jgi:pyruvate kinase
VPAWQLKMVAKCLHAAVLMAANGLQSADINPSSAYAKASDYAKATSDKTAAWAIAEGDGSTDKSPASGCALAESIAYATIHCTHPESIQYR